MATKRVISQKELTLLALTLTLTLWQFYTLATTGLGFLALFLLVALLFFIPVNLVVAELSSKMPHTSGVYFWVSKAYGDKLGFLTVFWQFLWCSFWYPAALAMTVSALTYVSNPQLAENKLIIFFGSTALIWLLTLLNCKGLKGSVVFSSVAVVAGTIAPTVALILIGGYFALTTSTLSESITFSSFIPKINLNTLNLASQAAVSFIGMQLLTSYSSAIKTPKKTFSKAIFSTTWIATVLYFLGVAALLVIKPLSNIKLGTHLLDIIEQFLTLFGLNFFLPIVALLIALSMIGLVNTWLFTSTTAVVAAGKMGALPPYFQKLNQSDAPERLLVAQAILCTLTCSYIFIAPSQNMFFWLLPTVSIALIFPSIFFLMLSAYRLRKIVPHVEGAYKIPGGQWGIAIACILGGFSSLFFLISGFFPPKELLFSLKTNHFSFLGLLLLICYIAPLVICGLKTSEWKNR